MTVKNIYMIKERNERSPFLRMYDCMYLPTVPPNHKPPAKLREEALSPDEHRTAQHTKHTMSSTIVISSITLTARAFHLGVPSLEKLPPSFFLTSGAKNIYFHGGTEENAGEMRRCIGERRLRVVCIHRKEEEGSLPPPWALVV